MEIAKPEDEKIQDISVKQPMGIDLNTMIMMADHTSKPFGAIVLGDKLFLGGKVTNIIKDKSQDMYNYKGIYCTGNMKILEDGRWIKIEEGQKIPRLTNAEFTEICLLQSEIQLFMTADNQVWSSNLEDVTIELNSKHELNSLLANSMKALK